MTYSKIYSGVVNAFADTIASLSAFQDWVGTPGDATAAAAFVNKWYFPPRRARETRKLCMIDLGQEHTASREALTSSNDYFRTGSVVWFLRQELSGVGDSVQAYQDSTESFFDSVSLIQADFEAIGQIATTPSNIVPMSVEMQGWWRPDEEEEATQGDFLEWWSVITYRRSS